MAQVVQGTQSVGGLDFIRFALRMSRVWQRRFYKGALVLSDGLMLALAFAMAYWARFTLGLPVFDLAVHPPTFFYVRLACMLTGLWILVFALFSAYNWENLLEGTREYRAVANACTIATVLVIAAGFLWPDFVVARGWLLSAWILTIFASVGGRFIMRRVVYRLRLLGYFLSPTLVVGTNSEAVAVASQLAGWVTAGLDVIGLVGPSTGASLGVPNQFPTLGDLQAVPDLVEQYHIEEIVVAPSALTSEQLLDLFRRYGTCEDVNLRLSSGLFDIISTGLSVKSLGYVPLIGINKMRLSPFETLFKNCLDAVGALCGLIAILPLLAAIALAIRLDSPGPVIYRRRVLGHGGTSFDAYKFRTMRVNGDDLLTAAQRTELQTYGKLKQDPRVTRTGHFLRRYSLDELPQLLNVLRGQMSLVGPRMISPQERDKYGKWDMNLLTVKPGLSGLWQVSGRSDVAYEERVQLDLSYIRNYTIWLDLQILLRTFVVVVKGKGAY